MCFDPVFGEFSHEDTCQVLSVDEYVAITHSVALTAFDLARSTKAVFKASMSSAKNLSRLVLNLASSTNHGSNKRRSFSAKCKASASRGWSVVRRMLSRTFACNGRSNASFAIVSWIIVSGSSESSSVVTFKYFATSVVGSSGSRGMTGEVDRDRPPRMVEKVRISFWIP